MMFIGITSLERKARMLYWVPFREDDVNFMSLLLISFTPFVMILQEVQNGSIFSRKLSDALIGLLLARNNFPRGE
jgi:hypothetical protein